MRQYQTSHVHVYNPKDRHRGLVKVFIKRPVIDSSLANPTYHITLISLAQPAVFCNLLLLVLSL